MLIDVLLRSLDTKKKKKKKESSSGTREDNDALDYKKTGSKSLNDPCSDRSIYLRQQSPNKISKKEQPYQLHQESLI